MGRRARRSIAAVLAESAVMIHAYRMLRRVTAPASPPSIIRPVPSWARPKAQSFHVVDAAFLAGANVAALDPIARDMAVGWRPAPAPGAAGRSRQSAPDRPPGGSKPAARCPLLRRPGDDPGPAGKVLLAWRQLVGRSPDYSPDAIARAAAGFGLAVSAA